MNNRNSPLIIKCLQAKEKHRMIKFRRLAKWAVDSIQSYYIAWKVRISSLLNNSKIISIIITNAIRLVKIFRNVNFFLHL